MSYRTFKRSCRNWKEFSSARKITYSTGLTREEAYEECQNFNNNRTSAQIARGTKLEFTEE